MGSSGGGGASESTQYVSQLPEYAEPYFKDLMQRVSYETSQPYEAYGGQRMADFNDAEKYGLDSMIGMGYSGENQYLGSGADMTQFSTSWNPANAIDTGPVYSGYGAQAPGAGTGYSASQRDSGYQAEGLGPPSYQPGQYDVGYDAGGVENEYEPSQYGMSYDGPGQYQPTYQAGQYDTGGIDALQDTASREMGYQAGNLGQGYMANQRDVGFDPGTLTDAEKLKAYMSPYMDQVVGVQKDAARKESDERMAQLGTQAAGSGSLGGYREAVMRGIEAEDSADLLNEIEATGRQGAFDAAINNMLADREGRAQLEQFQQSQFGQNEQMRQIQDELEQGRFGANQSAQQMQEQFGQSQFGLNNQWGIEAERLGMQAFDMNEGARQAQESFAQSAFGANEDAKAQFESLQQQGWNMQEAANQVAQQFDLDTGQLNESFQQAEESFKQQAFGQNEQMRQMYEQFRQSGYSAEQAAFQMQEQLAQSQFGMNSQNQQFGASHGLNAYNSYEQARQQAAALGLDAQQIQQAGQIAAAQAGLGYQGNLLGAGAQMGQFADLGQSQEYERIANMMQAGGTYRGLEQQGLDMQYQDFLRQKAWPMEQINQYARILYGTPIAPDQTKTTYGSAPSAGSQIAGGGLNALAMYMMMNQGGGKGG